jgi:long-chain acyl-CoA synthetase
VINIQQQTREPSAFSIIEVAASRWGDNAACIDNAGTVSFKQLREHSLAVAEALKTLKLPPLTIIGISATRARDFLPALFGVLAVGAVAMPIAPELEAPGQKRLIHETGITWLITSKLGTNSHDAGSAIGGTALALHQIPTSLPLPHFAPLFPDAAVIRHTSGTTGPSRGVVLSHRGIEERTSASQQLLDVREGDIILSPLSVSYHFIASALTFLRTGATILDAAALTPQEAFDLAKARRASMIYASPETYEALAKLPGAHELWHLRRAVSSSASLQRKTALAFASTFNLPITQALGIIEVGLPLWNEHGSADSSSLGRCMPPFKARLVNDHAHDIPQGEIGELLISGPGLFSGYISLDPTQSYRHPDSWFRTGDAVSQAADGTFTYHGRISSAITMGGHTLFPEQIESAIREHTDIAQIRVRLKILGDGTQHLIAEIVPRDGQTLSCEKLRAVCNEHLPTHLIPSEWLIVDHIPLTGSGKIMRHNYTPPEDAETD